MDRYFKLTSPGIWLVLLLLFFSGAPGTVPALIVLWLLWLAVGFRGVVTALARRFREFVGLVLPPPCFPSTLPFLPVPSVLISTATISPSLLTTVLPHARAPRGGVAPRTPRC